MDSQKLKIVLGCFVAAAFVYSLTRDPWDPSQLKTLNGAVSDYSEVRERRRSCFVIRMANIKESFELCSSSYDNFDKPRFEREVQKGTFLELKVVDEIKRNSSTGETKYWVEDIRTPDGRVYLELEDIQKSLKGERTIGRILMVGLVVAALVNLRKAITK